MADYPPFMNAYGNIPKILKKIQEAKTPDRFTTDFLGTVLGFTGGSSRPFIPLVKRLGLLSSDGVPTELYRRFRNPNQAGAAMAQALRRGYGELYARNEYAHALDKKNLTGLVMEVTGLDSNAASLRSIVNTFEQLRQFADFDATDGSSGDVPKLGAEPEEEKPKKTKRPKLDDEIVDELRFSYTIFLNLPNTSDIDVFNAIFKSLKDNLLHR